MKVILTEKPSVARDIAAHLGARTRYDGYFEGNGYQITWAFGHLVTLKEPEDYMPMLKKWSLDTLPFIPTQFELKVVGHKSGQKQFGIIKRLFKSASELICATDAGREGELIFRYILMMTGCMHKPWKRLWLSSLTEEALAHGFKSLRPGTDYDHLYAAAKCRSEADWIVGLNATRNFTVRFGGQGRLWSVGRVQTPVLALIVKREDEIRNFKSEPFWEVLTKYRETTFKFKGERFKVKEAAQQLLNAVQSHPLHIEKVTKKQENEPPPLLYDLTELQRDMNRKFGMSAADTLQTAQMLYEHKLITYPRTDSRYLTSDMQAECSTILQKLKKIRNQEISFLDLTQLAFSLRIVNDKKVTDHHAIIPTGKLPQALPLCAQRVFDAIVIRLIAVFYPHCLKEHTTVEAQCNQVPFQAKGVRILHLGWSVLYPKPPIEAAKGSKDVLEAQELPQFHIRESGPHAPYITEGKTKPPAHYSENTLLGAMEMAGKLVDDEYMREALKDKGLGTPATRAAIIETLLKRSYIERCGKTITATPYGRYLIAFIQDPNLKSAELTGEWEAKLKQIELGNLSTLDFMQQIAQYVAKVIAESDVSKINYEIYGPCPRCKQPVIKGKKGYGCSKWNEGCQFVLWKEYKQIQLNEMHIRTLLQKRILMHPMQGTILSFSEQGDLQEISLPQILAHKNYPYSKKRSTHT